MTCSLQLRYPPSSGRGVGGSRVESWQARRNGCKVVNRYKLPVIKSVHGDIKSNMVAIVNKTV